MLAIRSLPKTRAPLAVAFLAACAAAHGGTYFGPGSSTGTGAPMGPAAPTGPTSSGAPTGGSVLGGPSTGGGPGVTDSTSWHTWWGLHRGSYLELRRALRAAPTTASDEDAFLGFSGAVAGQRRVSRDQLLARVVPALIAALERERNPDVLSGALLALAKLGDDALDPEGRIRSALLRHLPHANQEVAESAVIGLGILGSPGAAPTLAALVRDDSGGRQEVRSGTVPLRTRAFAAYALGLIGVRHANPDIKRYCAQVLTPVIESGAGRGADLRVAAVLALGLLPVEPMALPADDGVEERVPTASRATEIDWLGRVGLDARQDEAVRAQVPVSLARLAHAAPVAMKQGIALRALEFVGARTEASAALQQSAVQALGLLGDNDEDVLDRRVAEALRSATHQGDRYARRLAYIALARAGARDGMAGGRDVGLRNARGFLVDELRGPDGLARPWAALALGVLEHARIRLGETSSAESTAALRAALAAHDAPIEAGAYCIALGLARDLSARGAIESHALKTRDDELQASACIALGMIGATESIPALRGVVNSSRHRPLVLRDASIALGLLGDHELVPTLIGWLRDAPNSGQLSATATALGWIGDQRAIEPLCQMLDSDSAPDRARAFAAVALGLVCEKDFLPWNSVYARDLVWWLAPPTLFDPVTGSGILDLF